ncbi:MAG: hypothetical protein JW709_13920 [Sedimentisphaerales bacterium]|nr:hypothetical protein [Sedimentisphaerales bacterium]
MKYLKLLVCLLVLALCRSPLNAAHFVAEHESLYANSNAITESITVPEQTDSQNHWGGHYVETYSHTEIEDMEMDAIAEGQGKVETINIPFTSYETDPAVLDIESHALSFADLPSENGVHAKGWVNLSSVAPGSATGQFYRIDPDGTENTGDLVTVSLDYIVDIYFSGYGVTNSGSVHGGFAGDNLLITLNCADWDDPQPGEIVRSYSKKDVDGHYEDHDSIQVAIGDIIGIHFGVSSATETYTTETGGGSETYLTMCMVITSYDGPPPFDPAKADLNGDGRVDVLDLALFASAWLWEESE